MTHRFRPSPLSILFIALTAVDAVILMLAANVRYSGSDAAGNGMANGLQAAYTLAGIVAVAVIALLFAVIRYRPVRIALLVLQLGATVLIGQLLE